MTAKTVLIVDDQAGAYLERLAPRFTHIEWVAVPSASEAMERVHAAEVLMARGSLLTRSLLAGAQRLEWIQVLTSGVDSVDLGDARPTVTSLRGVHGPQMAELAFLYMLADARRYDRLREQQAAHRWERFLPATLAGKTAVLVGLGSVAEALAARCRAFEMRCVGVSGRTQVDFVDQVVPRERLDEAASMADYLIVLVPGDASNERLVSSRVLAAMKPSAMLINLARGSVVDEAALVERLRSGALRAAGLDVFRDEPLPAGHPLWGLPNVMVTPHLGGASEQYIERATRIIDHNLRMFTQGRIDLMRNLVRR